MLQRWVFYSLTTHGRVTVPGGSRISGAVTIAGIDGLFELFEADGLFLFLLSTTVSFDDEFFCHVKE